MTSPLIERLISDHQYPQLSTVNLQDFLQTHEYSVLFFSEDPKRFPESNDVAVVLPELIKAFPQLQAGVIDRQDEKKLQSQFGFMSWPALVFMHKEQYLGTLTGIKDWSDYLTDIPRILASEPTRPPSVGIPVVSN
ncbi:MAG: hydrogenase-1 expression HyaE [Thiolinea sp.]